MVKGKHAKSKGICSGKQGRTGGTEHSVFVFTVQSVFTVSLKSGIVMQTVI